LIAAALVASALAAPVGSAATKGTTAFTCKKKASEGGAGFTDADCRVQSESKAKYEHVAIAENTPTTTFTESVEAGGGGKEPTILKITFPGPTVFQFVAAEVNGAGWQENAKAANGEHYVRGEASYTYSGVEVTQPAGKGCKVSADEGGKAGKAGVIATSTLLTTTKERGDSVKLSPAIGSAFASFVISGCEGIYAPYNKTYEVGGSVIVPKEGARLVFKHAEITTQGTLVVTGGSKLGIEGAITVSGGGTESTYTSLSPTTVSNGETKGTTVFTCKKKVSEGGSGFLKEHCRPEDATEKGATYEHVTIPEGVFTGVEGSNKLTGGETATMKMATTVSGVPFELQATGASATGFVGNRRDPSGEHLAMGEGRAVFTGVSVTKPAGKGCKVFTYNEGKGAEGVIDTTRLRAATTGVGDAVEISGVESQILASFEVEGCETAALNGIWKIEGRVKGTPNGSALNFTHANTTEQKTLKTKGMTFTVGLEGSLTFRGAGAESTRTPLGATTVETP
jgi:hypothetical protein